jgi:hypothetical protein
MAGRPNPYEAEAAAIDERLNPPRPAPTAATNPYEAEAQQVDTKITGMRPPANPGYLAASPDDSTTETAAKFAATGALRGVSHLPGMVGDVRDLGNYLFDWTQHKVGGRPLDEVRAENAANRAKTAKEIYGDGWLRYISPANVLPSGSEVAAGLGKYTGLYDPTTPMGRIGMGALEAAFSGPVGAIKRGTSVPGALMESAAMAPAVAVGGGASTAAAEMGVENPFILMGAGLAGTAAAQKAAAVAGRGYNATIDALGPAWERRPDVELPDGSVMPGSAGTPILNKLPGVEGSGWRQAAREFQDITGRGAADPAAARDAALRALGTESYELVPGSRATTAQVTGDMGQQVLERALATSNKEPWLLRMGEQQAAQSRAVRGTAPEADIQALPRRLAESKQQMIQALDDHIARLTTDAADRASALGGLGGPAAAGSRIEQAMRPIWENALAKAQSATEGLGGTERAAINGARLRDAVQAVYGQAKSAADVLWNDFRNRYWEHAVPVRNVLEAAKDVRGQIGKYGAMLGDSTEGRLLSSLSAEKPLMTLGQIDDLRKAVGKMISDFEPTMADRGDAPALARMRRLYGALNEALDTASEKLINTEKAAVAKGEMRPEDTTAAFEQWVLNELRQYRANQGTVDLAATGTGDGRSAGTTELSPAPGGEGQGRGPMGRAPGAEGVPDGAPLLPPEGARAYRDARDAAAQYLRLDDSLAGTVRRADLPSEVPAIVFRQGPKGADTIREIRAQIGADNPNFEAGLREAATRSLRDSGAVDANGVLNPERYAAWARRHAEALSEIPDTARAIRDAADAGANMRSLEPYVPGTPPEVLPTHFFRAGPAGAEGVRELRRMIGPQAADDIMADYGASLIQSKAVVNGMVDEGRLRSLTQSYAGAFGEVPALRAAANDAAEAAKIVAEAARARKDALANMERSAFGKIAGMSTDAEVRSKIGTLLGSASGERELGRLIADLKASPDSEMALAGLRRAAAEHVADRLTANGEAFGQGLDSARMKSDQAQSYIRANESRLRLALGDDGFDVLEKIALDLKRQQRSLTGGSLPARSNTTPDALETMRYAVPDMRQSWVSSVWSQFTPSRGALAMFIGAPYAVALGTADWVTALGGRLRAAGIQNRQDFLTAMVMHPEIAAKGLMEMPREPKASAPFIRALGNLSVMNPRREED